VPVAEIESNLQSVVDLARKHDPNIKIVIAGLQLPQPATDPYLEAFRSMFSGLAERNHALLVPFLLRGVFGDPSLNLPDLIHPNASGQKILAANVWPVVEKVLREHQLPAMHPRAPRDAK
jgi:acyl-CoA thioesterase-1